MIRLSWAIHTTFR